MNVYILGGLGTKYFHIAKTISLYNKLGIKSHFYPARGFFANHLFSPRKYKEMSDNIIEDIKKNNTPFILHSMSASCWSSLYINSKVASNKMIFDSGPFEINTGLFRKNINNIFNTNISLKNIEYFMKLLEIPVDINDPWFEEYVSQIPKNDALFLISKNDMMINKDYIENVFLHENSNNKMIIFNKSGHCNLIKKEPEKYEKTIRDFIFEKNN